MTGCPSNSLRTRAGNWHSPVDQRNQLQGKREKLPVQKGKMERVREQMLPEIWTSHPFTDLRPARQPACPHASTNERKRSPGWGVLVLLLPQPPIYIYIYIYIYINTFRTFRLRNVCVSLPAGFWIFLGGSCSGSIIPPHPSFEIHTSFSNASFTSWGKLPKLDYDFTD